MQLRGSVASQAMRMLYIDARTMEIHHTKHHQTYVDKLNAVIGDDPELKGYSAEELLKILEKVPEISEPPAGVHRGLFQCDRLGDGQRALH